MTNNIPNSRPTIYLAGGFHSGWQEAVRSSLRGWNILDPSEHGLTSAADYTRWDLAAIRNCDVVLANMERTNPAGFALSLEIGYAKALDKEIIFVESHPNPQRYEYFEMVREVADSVYSNLAEAIRSLSDRICALQIKDKPVQTSSYSSPVFLLGER